jgi:hypothetical protein
MVLTVQLSCDLPQVTPTLDGVPEQHERLKFVLTQLYVKTPSQLRFSPACHGWPIPAALNCLKFIRQNTPASEWRRRILASAVTSAPGQKRKLTNTLPSSAQPPRADIPHQGCHLRKVPVTNIASYGHGLFGFPDQIASTNNIAGRSR